MFALACDRSQTLGDFGLEQGLNFGLNLAMTGFGAYAQYMGIQNQNAMSASQQKLADAQAQLIQANAQIAAAEAHQIQTSVPTSAFVASVATNPLVIVGVVAGAGILLWLATRRR